ncbi:MAG TPA: nicotinamide-nucleotide adenylyltransferase [Candidatus Nitrosopolaris sp.]|nr:nicotinamide-nucleotide adenylyltransferase [Candidatus Nitrosopolaris sp.]
MLVNSKRGLMVGRFQPFHKGHLCLVGQIFEDCDEIIIAIGSAQINYSYTDPFTAGERIMMIHAALVESKIDMTKCFIVPVVNDENNARWFGHLKSMVPHFDILYSGNEFVTNLVAHHTEVLKPRFSRKKEYNGTNIRKLMSRSFRWKKFVPNSVAGIIEQIDGVTRIRFLLDEKLSEKEKNEI